jgi:hypothetical protein
VLDEQKEGLIEVETLQEMGLRRRGIPPMASLPAAIANGDPAKAGVVGHPKLPARSGGDEA